MIEITKNTKYIITSYDVKVNGKTRQRFATYEDAKNYAVSLSYYLKQDTTDKGNT